MWFWFLLFSGLLGLILSSLLRCITKEGSKIHYISVYVYFASFITFMSWGYIIVRVLLLPFTRNNLFTYFHKLKRPFFKQFRNTLKVVNPNYLNIEGGAVVVANHQSSFDIFVIYSIWQYAKNMALVAKRTLYYLGPFGLCGWLGGMIPIDRKNQAEARNTMDRVSKAIREDKTKVLIFVEGTRNIQVNKTRKLLPFKTGAFRMAIECQVPIIPIIISPYYFNVSEFNFFGKGEHAIEVLPPIDTKGMKLEDTKRLIAETEKRMQKAYSEYVKDLDNRLPSNHPYLKLQN